jgi:acyl-coenzyme A synthetase/AMP-(fatty) acid ligase
MTNLFSEIRKVAAHSPVAAAFVNGHSAFTYAELVEMAQRASRWLMDQGLTKGQRVSLNVPPEYHAILTLASLQLGCPTAIWVNQGVFERDGFELLVTVDQVPHVKRVLLVPRDWPRVLLELSPLLEEADLEATELVRIVYSSGTTGAPKGVPFTLQMVEERIRVGRTHWLIGEPYMSLLGPTTAIGIFALLSQLLSGTTYFSPGLADKNAATIQRHNVRHLLASPAQLKSLISFCVGNKIELDSLVDVTVVGSTLPPGLRTKVLENFGASLRNLYGSTETGVISVTESGQSDSMNVGHPIDGVKLEIVDSSGRVLPKGVEGEVRIKTGQMINGYIGEEPGHGSGFSGGWFYPGDLGFMSDTGDLHLNGRRQEILNVGGVKLNLLQLEEAVSALPFVEEAGIAALEVDEDLPGLGLAFVAGPSATDENLRSAFIEMVPPEVTTLVKRVSSLPRSEDGKLSRSKISELFRDA